jgi:hypothetical protein
MLRYDTPLARVAMLWAGASAASCSGGAHRASEDANVSHEGGAGQDEGIDVSGLDHDATSPADGAPSDAAAADAGRMDATADTQGSTDSDASGGDGSALGPILVPGPPFAAPAMPVRRLAVGTSSVCIILEDRRVQCISGFDAGGADFSAEVPGNHDFVMLAKSEEDLGPFIGIRADGSVATWSGVVPDEALPGAGYIDAFGSNENLCGLKNTGEIVCVGKGTVPTYPPGPYLQFAGRTHNVPKGYAGLRADGVIVTNPQNVDGGVQFFNGETFVGVAMRMEPPVCGLGKSGSVFCSASIGNSGLMRQPFSNVRDVSCGGIHICAVLADGQATCLNPSGSVSGSAVPKDKRFVDIDTRDYAGTCGTTETGELWCWTKRQGSALQIVLSMKAALK